MKEKPQVDASKGMACAPVLVHTRLQAEETYVLRHGAAMWHMRRLALVFCRCCRAVIRLERRSVPSLPSLDIEV